MLQNLSYPCKYVFFKNPQQQGYSVYVSRWLRLPAWEHKSCTYQRVTLCSGWWCCGKTPAGSRWRWGWPRGWCCLQTRTGSCRTSCNTASTGSGGSWDTTNIPWREKKETSHSHVSGFISQTSKPPQKQGYLCRQQVMAQEYFTKELRLIHLWHYISASPKYTPILLWLTNQQEVRKLASSGFFIGF